MIYYLCEDYPHPSWGIGVLYSHVEMLQQSGFQAAMLHLNPGFSLKWMDSSAPRRYLHDKAFRLHPEDILVVPEVLAADRRFRFHCRRLVMVQNVFLIHSSLKGAESYSELGFEHAIAVMPHQKQVVERHYDLETSVISVFIPDLFFSLLESPREKRILTISKPVYSTHLGLPDYEVLVAGIRRILVDRPGWTLLEISGKSHAQVAQLMQTSQFLASVNSLEGFNATVPEAMASGCIPLCYDAFGGADYLRPGVDSFVFPNHHVYPMLDKIEELTAGDGDFSQMKQAARETAEQYRRERTRTELLDFYENLRR